jgi:hypothetical protein
VTPVTASEAESGHAGRAVDIEAPPEVAAEAGRSLTFTSPTIRACPRICPPTIPTVEKSPAVRAERKAGLRSRYKRCSRKRFPHQSNSGRGDWFRQPERKAPPKRGKNSSWKQDEDTATDTQIATVLRREETAARKAPPSMSGAKVDRQCSFAEEDALLSTRSPIRSAAIWFFEKSTFRTESPG